MQIPPTSPGSNFPYQGDPRKEAAQLNQGIQNDLNKLMSAQLSPGEEKLVSFDLQRKSSALGKLQSTYPNDFTKSQKKIINELQAQIEAMSEQMNPPSPGELQLALATSGQLHF